MKDICITCCWEGLVTYGWHLAKLAFWPAVIYAAVYGLGAIAFLANLRAKVGPTGRSVVEHDSWAYMLARPYRYGKLKAGYERPEWTEPTGICSLYARLFNMLLFVWPFLLVYLAVVSLLGTVLFGVLLGVGYVRPDFTHEGWVSRVDVADIDSWPNSWRVLLRLPFVYYLAAFTLFMVIAHFTAFLHGLWLTLLVILCILPLLALIAAVVFGSRKVVREKDDGTTKVGLAAEFIASKKEGWCKIVEIK
jgi:hypothetical protein